MLLEKGALTLSQDPHLISQNRGCERSVPGDEEESIDAPKLEAARLRSVPYA
jgi:hypothetical protein